MDYDRIPIVTSARKDPRQAARVFATSYSSRGSRGVRATAALVLSVLVASGAVGATSAAPLPAGLDAPIHAFGWPADGSPNDPYFGLQSDLEPIGVAAAWSKTTGAPGVVVAVLDTGIDALNPEFAGRLVPGFNALTGDEDTANFGPTTDDEGHGTHVSGTVAAAADNATGIAGIAPNVSIMPIKVLDSLGEGDFGDLIAGMNWAIAHDARIITMSLGGTLSPGTVASMQRTFDTAHATGVIVLAASGNEGRAIDNYPCNFTYVICVGSTTKDGTAVSSFSTRTPAISLVAPGEQIASTVPGGGYGFGSGTSMATPHVTGAVALLRSVRPTLTPDEALATLIQSARPLVGGNVPNPDSGYGLLQVGAAVDLVLAMTPSPTASPASLPSPSPSPTPDPNASPIPSPSPTPDPGLSPVPMPELIVPAVTASSPRNGARLVARSTRPRITFSVPMVGVSTRTVRMMDLSRGRWVAIRISYSASTRVAVIIPGTRLAANHSYRVTVGGILAASSGAALRRTFIVTFRTGYR